MFAKHAHIAAAIALTFASGAFAQSTDRNVFDTETNLRIPAAQSTVSREEVRAAYIAQRDAKGISSFNPEGYRQEQIAGAGAGLVALFHRDAAPTVAQAGGKTRAEVRAEFLTARANGELNQFDTETNLRVPATVRRPAPTALAQR
jgi:hypothetical protein